MQSRLICIVISLIISLILVSCITRSNVPGDCSAFFTAIIFGPDYDQAMDDFQSGNYDSAVRTFNRYLRDSILIDDQLKIAILKDNIAWIYLRTGQLDEAERLANEAVQINIMIENSEGLAYNYQTLALIEKERGQYTESLEYCQSALEIYNYCEYYPGMAACYHLFAKILFDVRNTNNAIIYLQEAISINSMLANYSSLSSNYTLLGDIYMQRREYANAINSYTRALQIDRDNELISYISWDHRNLGKANEALGNLGRAVDHYINSVNHLQTLLEDSDSDDLKQDAVDVISLLLPVLQQLIDNPDLANAENEAVNNEPMDYGALHEQYLVIREELKADMESGSQELIDLEEEE